MRALLAVGVLLCTLPAQAKCAMPSPYVLPRPGTPLPPNPTLYLFVPPDSKNATAFAEVMRAVTESGTELPLTVRAVKGGAELQVFRLQLVAAAGVRFRLTPVLEKEATWSVEPGVVFPPDFEVTRGKDLFRSWNCSYESSRVLDTSLEAPAYRVDFAGTQAGLLAGKGESVIVEGDAGGFRWGDARPAPLRAVRLGHHDCWGSNLTWEKSTALVVRVTALLPDGSERKSDKLFVLDPPRPWGSKE
ncbi:MAG: hypothetical protein Q8L48_01950 [Archangium sp.]|nr:hypothetical protein [Archangium sp.]